MKFLSTWSIRPESRREAIELFLAGRGALPAAVTLLGRWHKADGSGGFSLMETDDPKAIYENAVFWSQYLTYDVELVVDEADAASIAGKIFKK
jgi:hypothetical protein